MSTLRHFAWVLLLLSSATMAAEPASAGPELAAMAMRVVLSLVAVIAVVMLAAWMMRRLQSGISSAPRRLRVLESHSLGVKERMVLVAVGEQQILLGIAPGHVHTLHVLSTPLPELEVADGGNRFANVLAKMRGPESKA
ncbi:MAG: flagellar biosynthetic protein FliO [Gammaproteobacteria bacterium HGW-Gammaproteobacteria-6]|nr:MAG: flagellar biosynthetic protein FliO [Gammaproteobacteria bacterium HGW-Gammaproteobacteria-6]